MINLVLAILLSVNGAFAQSRSSGSGSSGSGGAGTVTSVDMSVPSFLSITGNPVTTTGTLALTLNNASPLPAVNGGSTSPDSITNCSIDATVAANALTVSILTAAGGTPSATDPCIIGFRNATLTTGTYALVSVTAATTVVVPDTATLGCVISTDCPIYVYAINNAGTIVAGVGSWRMFDEGNVQSTTAVGAGSTAFGTVYSTAGQSNKAVRLLGEAVIQLGASSHWSNAATTKKNVPFKHYMSEFTTCTPTGLWNTNTTYSGFCKRTSDQLTAHYKVLLSGAPNSTSLAFTLTHGMVIDTTKLASSLANGTVLPGSQCRAIDTGTNNYVCNANYATTTSVSAMQQVVSGTILLSSSNVTQALPFAFGNTDWVEVAFSAPIVGWGG